MKALPSPSEEEQNFEIEVSDFMYLRRGIKQSRALRFTVTWKFDHPQYGLLGASQEGWIMTRDANSRLKVSPPLSRFGVMQQKQLTLITVGLHDLILGLIVNHKTKKGKSYADYVGNVVSAIHPENPADVDEELPQEINANAKSGN